MLLQYAQDVPITSTLNMFGLRVSYKSVLYLFALQCVLAGKDGFLAVVPAMSGIAAGLIYRSVGSLQRWRFPAFLSAPAAKVRFVAHSMGSHFCCRSTCCR